MAKEKPGTPELYIVKLRGSSAEYEVEATSQNDACQKIKAQLDSKRGIANFVAVPKRLTPPPGGPSVRPPKNDNV